MSTKELLQAAVASWLDVACFRHPRVFGGLPTLHRGFCRWQAEQSQRVPSLEAFELLLAERGFLIGEICGTRFVCGLMVRQHSLTHEQHTKRHEA
jgi:hypothetical protein